MGPLPDHVFLKRGSSSLWIARDLNGDPKLDLLADPDLLFSSPECEIIKDQRKIKVGRVRVEIGARIKGIYLKRYNAFSWRYRLGSLFISSAAFRSWVGARILMQAGFQTGEPIAAVECRSWGMLTKSFYLAEEIPSGRTVDTHWREELMPVTESDGYRRRNFLKALAKLFRSLHKLDIYHNDLKDANIIVCTEGKPLESSFYLLDLEGVKRFRHLNERRRIKNLVQLNRTMGRWLRSTEKLYFLKVYLGNGFNHRERRRWVRRILKRSRRKDRRYLKRWSKILHKTREAYGS